jgi:hypothetical protein
MESIYAPEYSECATEPMHRGAAWPASPAGGSQAPAPQHRRSGRASRWAIVAVAAGQQAAIAGRCSRLIARLQQAGHPRAARLVHRVCLRRMLLLRLLGGEHGEFTLRARGGQRTLAFERGIIQSASPGQVVVRAADGTTWTWRVDGRTRLRAARERVTSQALVAGRRVFTAGPVSGAVRHARLILIARAPARHIS